MNEFEQPDFEQKQRHGCVTAWLVLLLLANSITALTNLFAADFVMKALPQAAPSYLVILLGIIGIANVFFAYRLLKWKKDGFWGVAVSALVAVFINFSIGMGTMLSLAGLIGVVSYSQSYKLKPTAPQLGITWSESLPLWLLLPGYTTCGAHVHCPHP
ncbi:MAG: hypothetical protein HYZ16_09955 [Bacteroidetes bacterium]|jgi:hypothetical protein|nr:hypothetical protein [Bacteroidota bacterium]